ncbi:thiamine phosphate synthase [Croceibacterium atlanticum]|nr:thiamine phosphate synthase [Croceibacterium atlanticum]
MRLCQTRPAFHRADLPELWLISDRRNDPVLETALANMPRGSALIYRHYHLAPDARLARYREVARIARARDHLLILADSARTAREWGADGCYGAPPGLPPRCSGLLTLATVHDLHEIGQANRIGADAALLSPVFPTRSHPGAATLGPLRFRLLARHAAMPVIALGGMDRRGAERLGWSRWAAIDGLSRYGAAGAGEML